MSGYANPDRPDERLSTAEREEAVTRLSEFHVEGRITSPEFDERAAAARAAVTRGDLVPLFADLPSAGPSWESEPWAAAPAASAATGTPGPPLPPPPASAALAAGPARTSRALGGRVGDTVMALTPFLALALFFLFGFAGGFVWSWLWFLIIPIVAIVIYGPTGKPDSER
ncbi:DUF1707 SHOCT-like domain-containing protein [Agromyces indicus]|uniref:DUF1707 domain-containing protein n=1 Tax=Agromyces indicus TaxID=758919 RepID=A0ABU1FGP1_9MICO|nr:DUF1707 domain-containing protein [Agromyces indicus]MDR5690928.1 DUF1707 domain-containing protein [Agromyces indicus]